MNPTEYSPRIAEYYTTMDLPLDALCNCFVDCNMLAPIEMYKFSNPVTGEHGGRQINLLRDSNLVPLESTFASPCVMIAPSHRLLRVIQSNSPPSLLSSLPSAV